MNSVVFLVSFIALLALPGRSGEIAVPFLGVATRPLSAEESRELALPAGVGLKVEEVVAGSPAASELIFGDVLRKLDDQILVNPRQLAVLVRLRDPGEKVKLGLVRDGEPSTVTVSLGERPLIESAQLEPGSSFGPGTRFPQGFGQADPWSGMDPHERMEQLQARMRDMMRGLDSDMPLREGLHRGRHMEWHENGTSMRLTEKDGDARLKITEGDKEIFDGPVNTKEDRAKIPEPYLDKLEARDAFGDPGTML